MVTKNLHLPRGSRFEDDPTVPISSEETGTQEGDSQKPLQLVKTFLN